MPQPPDKPAMQKPQDVVNVVYNLAMILSSVFIPILRRGFGVRAFKGYWITLILLIFAAPYLNCRQLTAYIPVWLALLAVHRLTPDRTQHSQYQGYPWLMRLIPFVRGEYQARFLEPFVVFFAAAYAVQYSLPLAKFMLGGAVSLFVVLATEVVLLNVRKTMAHDAEVEARRAAAIHQGWSWWRD